MKFFKSNFKRSLLALLILQFVFASSIVFNVNVEDVSAVPSYPCIKVVPEQTVDPLVTVGMTYTIDIVTDYTGSDIWSWQFSLTFDPDILQGGVNATDIWTGNNVTKNFYTTKKPIAPGSDRVYVNQTLQIRLADYAINYATGLISFKKAPGPGLEVKAVYTVPGVVNGDLITTAKNSNATILLGNFNNTAGKLSLTGAFFYYVTPTPPFTTSGPGTLARIIFEVVGTGFSNITLGTDTKLLGWDPLNTPPPEGTMTTIIDAATMPANIGHGYFDNIPDVHDVRVSKLTAPATAIPGDNVPINVTVRNEGNYTENFNVAVYSNATFVGTQAASLARGTKNTLTFYWDTTYSVPGNYTLNATADLPGDFDPSDNNATAQIEVKSVCDVSVTSLEIPTTIILGNIVPINVTVTNEGNLQANVTLLVSYEQEYVPIPLTGNISISNFMLAERPASNSTLINWNTAGLAIGSYTINATAIVDEDEDLSHNTLTKLVLVKLGRDVEITGVDPKPRKVFVGELIEITVGVRNNGGDNETFNIKVTYNTTEIETRLIESLTPSNLPKYVKFTWNTTGVKPSSYEITAEAVLPEDVFQDNNKDSYRHVFVDAPVGNINGTVVDSVTGLPIEGATVAAGEYSNTTDAEGYYLIQNVQAGTHDVTASKDGYQNASETIVVVAGQTYNLNFSLTPIYTTGTITGAVTDASTEDPVEGANVTANGHSTITDANGQYSLSNIPAGNYTVTASKDGYESSSEANIPVTAGQTTTVDLELNPIPQSDITLYIAIAGIGIIVVAGVLIYFLKFRKRT